MNKLLMCGLALAPVANGFAAEKQNPDVLFIFVDDMTYNGVRALGNKQVMTPNMDKIVKMGVSFTNTHNMGGWNGALSMASRTQLMTGKFLWNAYAEQEKDKCKSMVANGEMWPQVMKEVGYKSFHTGKWHVPGVNPVTIFDGVDTPRPGMPRDNQKTTRKGYNRPLSRDDNSWSPYDETQPGYWDGGKHWSEVQADIIIDYMKDNKDSEQPLFMTCAFNAPHDPRQSPKSFLDMYNVDDMIVPESYMPAHPYMEEMRSGREVRDEQLGPFPRTEYAVQKHIQEYYAIITHLDVQIGRILETLEKSGRADNTLLVFTADNGLAMGRHGFLGKQSLYEHSMKIPLVIAGCGLPKNVKREQMVYMQDIVPTVYEFAGVKNPSEHTDFNSLMPLVKSAKAKSAYEYMYGAYMDRQRMVSDGRYKLLVIPPANKIYLFDLKNDPEEITDLYGDPKYADVVKRLKAAYAKRAAELNDIYDYDLTKM